MDLNMLIMIATLILSAGIAFGTTKATLASINARIKALEEKHNGDHDLLIRLDEKVSMILKKMDR